MAEPTYMRYISATKYLDICRCLIVAKTLYVVCNVMMAVLTFTANVVIALHTYVHSRYMYCSSREL